MKLKVFHNTLGKLFFLLTALLISFPVLTFELRSLVTMLWAITGVSHFIAKEKVKWKFKKSILWFSLPFLFLIISLSYTSNVREGFSEIEKMLSFFVIPLIFYLNQNFFNDKRIEKLVLVFVLAVLVFFVYQSSQVLINIDFLMGDLSPQEIKSNGFKSIEDIGHNIKNRIKLRRFRNFLIDISNSHTTYQGLWIVFCVFVLGKSIVEDKNKKRFTVVFYVFLILFLLLWIFLISARAPLGAFLISILILAFFFKKRLPLKHKRIIQIGFTAFLTVALLTKNPISFRINELLSSGFKTLSSNSKKEEFNSSNVRNGIYFCDAKLIGENYLLGLGIGDVQAQLNKCYQKEFNSKVYQWKDYNSHNQYAFFWLSSGVFGLLSFLILLFLLLKDALKKRSAIFMHFILIFSIVFLTENVLVRSDGLLLFSLISGLFYFNDND